MLDCRDKKRSEGGVGRISPNIPTPQREVIDGFAIPTCFSLVIGHRTLTIARTITTGSGLADEDVDESRNNGRTHVENFEHDAISVSIIVCAVALCLQSAPKGAASDTEALDDICDCSD